MVKLAVMSAAFTVVTTVGAQAQYYVTTTPQDAPEPYVEDGEDRAGLAGPVGFNIGGALSLPVSDSGSRFDPGVGFTAGILFRPARSPVGIQGEYGFTFYDVEGDILEGSELDGDQQLHYGTLNVIVTPPKQQRFGFYLAGGGGIYYRNVELSEFAGVGAATFCDPLLFACYPQAVPVERVIGSQSSTDFGVNGGVGVFAMLGSPMKLYLEARYHYIWGPEFTSPSGNNVDSDGQYVPVVLGLAF